MKKLVFLLLLLTLCLGLAACAASDPTPAPTPSEKAQAPEETPEPSDDGLPDIDPNSWQFVLVNPWNEISGGAPALENFEGVPFDARIIGSLSDFAQGARDAGYSFRAFSGFRRSSRFSVCSRLTSRLGSQEKFCLTLALVRCTLSLEAELLDVARELFLMTPPSVDSSVSFVSSNTVLIFSSSYDILFTNPNLVPFNGAKKSQTWNHSRVLFLFSFKYKIFESLISALLRA